MSEDEWDLVFDTNVKGAFLVSRAAIPHLIESGGGAIVNVASQLAIAAVGGFAAYCASKAAVVHLTRSMALELISKGVERRARDLSAERAQAPLGQPSPIRRRAHGADRPGASPDFSCTNPAGPVGACETQGTQG